MRPWRRRVSADIDQAIGNVGWSKPPALAARPRPAPGQRPGAGTTALPEHAVHQEAATTTAASPGTGLTPHHETGGLAYLVRGWNCGCEIQFDPTGAVVWSWPCTARRPDFDDWLRKLTP